MSRLDSATPTKTTAATATNAASTAKDQTFHYRYRRLRLLIQGDNLMFLVPDTWSASNSTLVLPIDDGSVRAQFQFQNDPPLTESRAGPRSQPDVVVRGIEGRPFVVRHGQALADLCQRLEVALA